MQGLAFKGKKAQQLAKKLKSMKRDNEILDAFAEHLSNEIPPAEAAFRAGADRADGFKLLQKLRKRVGLYQAS